MPAARNALLAAACLLPALASAGEIYGKVTFAGASVGEGVEVAAACGARAYPPVKTDKTGGYHLVVDETGKCQLTISYQGETASMGIASYEDAAQADVVLEKKDGKLVARRR